MRPYLPLLAVLSSATAWAVVCATADQDLGSATGTVTTDTTGQPDDFAPSCQSSDGPDWAYEWVAPSDGTYSIATGGSLDTIISVYAADCVTEIACDDDGGAGLLSLVSLTALAGERFLINVDGYGGAAGIHDLTITLTSAPTCAPDIDLGSMIGPAVATGDTCGAGNDAADATCGSLQGSEDVIFTWTAPADATYTFDTEGSGYDTAMTVRGSGTCTELACDDDGGTDLLSSISMDLLQGDTVSIVVDGYSDTNCGPYNLNISDSTPCSDADGDGVCDVDDLCDGDDASGDSDSDGVCDDIDFSLDAGVAMVGQPITFTATNATPGARVYFLLSTVGPGAGPCHPTAGICADIRSPRVIGTPTADAAGMASVTVTIPATAPVGTNFAVQAAYVAGPGDADTSDVELRQIQ